jgi:hypothetical protein
MNSMNKREKVISHNLNELLTVVSFQQFSAVLFLILTCGAGDRIKPRVKHVACGILGTLAKINQARECGRQILDSNRMSAAHFVGLVI